MTTADLFSPLFRAVAAEFDAGIIVLDAERQVLHLNAQASTLLSVRGAVVGVGLISLLRDYQLDALVSEVLRDGETREMVFQPPSGNRTLRLRISRFEASGAFGAVVLIRDVTQLSMLERARRDMVANVSHELRNPLASVKLLVETLQSEPPPEVSRRMLSNLAQEVDAIAQLVDELHDLSQIEAGRVALQLSPLSLAPVVARALERIQPQAERKNLHVRSAVAPELPLALVDAHRIVQVLLNLLHNAVKFTPAGGEITVRAGVMTVAEAEPGRAEVLPGDLAPAYALRSTRARSAAPAPERATIALPYPLTAGEWLLLSVADSGIGIPAEDLPRIFERFYKVDRARTRNAGGTGLGLAIAKHLIEGHGGRIWAESEEGIGSAFYLALPSAE